MAKKKASKKSPVKKKEVVRAKPQLPSGPMEGEGYILLHKGMVQYMVQDGKKGMLYAFTRKLADSFAKASKDKKLSVAAVGSADGEYLSKHLKEAEKTGAGGLWHIRDNGLIFVPMDVIRHHFE